MTLALVAVFTAGAGTVQQHLPVLMAHTASRPTVVVGPVVFTAAPGQERARATTAAAAPATATTAATAAAAAATAAATTDRPRVLGPGTSAPGSAGGTGSAFAPRAAGR